jgi:hypothetical protein
VRAAFNQPGVASRVDVVKEKGATFLNRFNGNGWGGGWITGAQARAPKRLGVIALGFGSGQFTVGGATPKVHVAGTKEGSSENAERTHEMARIATLKSGSGKLQKKLLERLLRLRRVLGPRISGVNCQCAPFALAKRLKTIELHQTYA